MNMYSDPILGSTNRDIGEELDPMACFGINVLNEVLQGKNIVKTEKENLI